MRGSNPLRETFASRIAERWNAGRSWNSRVVYTPADFYDDVDEILPAFGEPA